MSDEGVGACVSNQLSIKNEAGGNGDVGSGTVNTKIKIKHSKATTAFLLLLQQKEVFMNFLYKSCEILLISQK